MGFVRGGVSSAVCNQLTGRKWRKGNGHSKRLTGHSRILRWYIRLGSRRLMSIL